ncbi:hypothetical protein GS597_13415 [Synechococcales cyanobacterium C]|uniref:Uncharacterized protein n=1 Tax=Petrachloros mirabilis ULC683 TaxID=2781853 RepID=A0A8K1ZZ49_9CYAN|nr:hypothetical protein [Petrachloros mirabilis]NCJ07488.1 hypothetical protein [Petrachloros mirabilis ULC683]
MDEAAHIQTLEEAMIQGTITLEEAIQAFADLAQQGSQNADVYYYLSSLHAHKAKLYYEQATQLGEPSWKLHSSCGACKTPLGHRGKWVNGYCVAC